jgi:hypothetical protein
VALKRENAGINPAQQAVIDAILDGPPALFGQVFELEARYPLPDGDSVYLYRQQNHLPPDYPVEYVTGLAESLDARTSASDVVLLTPSALAGPFVSHYDGPAQVHLAPETEQALVDITAGQRQILMILGDPAAGEASNLAREWLNRHAFFASHEWSDSLQLLTYGLVRGVPAEVPSTSVGANLGDRVVLSGYDLPAGDWGPDDIVPLTLFWQRLASVDEDLRVFVHLLDGSGQLVAQNDSAPVGGSRPVSSWQEGEIVVDRHGLGLPTGLPPGEYDLYVGLYQPATGDRLPVLNTAGEVLGDSVLLQRLEVGGP